MPSVIAAKQLWLFIVQNLFDPNVIKMEHLHLRLKLFFFDSLRLMENTNLLKGKVSFFLQKIATYFSIKFLISF